MYTCLCVDVCMHTDSYAGVDMEVVTVMVMAPMKVMVMILVMVMVMVMCQSMNACNAGRSLDCGKNVT